MNDNPLAAPVGRRTVLAAAAASGLLVACGSDSEDSTTAPTDNATDTPGGTSGEVLAALADVPVEGGTVNRDVHVVVTQPVAGQYRAFTSICTHQGCDVSRVNNNVITCGCHNSRFSAETGDVEGGPAPRGLAPIEVTVEGESIVRA
jgi:Rieske Fe-S protein